jgi:hypothetical protein
VPCRSIHMAFMNRFLLGVIGTLALSVLKAEGAGGPRNLVLFVADGLRARTYARCASRDARRDGLIRLPRSSKSKPPNNASDLL